MDSITSALDKFIDKSSLHPAVCHAALRGMLMLNKYYVRTDETIVYCIAMSESNFIYFHVISYLSLLIH